MEILMKTLALTFLCFLMVLSTNAFAEMTAGTEYSYFNLSSKKCEKIKITKNFTDEHMKIGGTVYFEYSKNKKQNEQYKQFKKMLDKCAGQ